MHKNWFWALNPTFEIYKKFPLNCTRFLESIIYSSIWHMHLLLANACTNIKYSTIIVNVHLAQYISLAKRDHMLMCYHVASFPTMLQHS